MLVMLRDKTAVWTILKYLLTSFQIGLDVYLRPMYLYTRRTTIRKKVLLKLWPQDLTSKCRWKLFRCGLLPGEGLLSAQNRVGVSDRPRAATGLPSITQAWRWSNSHMFFYKIMPKAGDYDKLSWKCGRNYTFNPHILLNFIKTLLMTKIMVYESEETGASCTLNMSWKLSSIGYIYFLLINWIH